MINFLEDCVSDYHIFLEKRKHDSENENQEKECFSETDCKRAIHKSFLEYARERFKSKASRLKSCLSILCTHIPKAYFLEHNVGDFETLFSLLDDLETQLSLDDLVSEEIEKLFSHSEALSALKTFRGSLSKLNFPSYRGKGSTKKYKNFIKRFCLQRASLLFSTASTSYEVDKVNLESLNVLVIDEAAQLKECESLIPLQLPGIQHSILIGDECQLSATVFSNVSAKAGFGRSLFERLSTLGHSKHLLNVQYRMHPSISRFPNAMFYNNRILDAAGVELKSYEKHYLPGPMFGPYSFINVPGREEVDDVGHSRRNMVEVAVVQRLVRNLFNGKYYFT
ncbi:hypothetical protein PTKIN_Ptkin02bG0046200 [Pterospermum kingtungense]